MSDRVLIAGAAVPMICGAVALTLLQRAPGVRATHAAAADGGKLALIAQDNAQARKPYVGVVLAGHTADLAAEAEGRVAQVLVQTGARVKAGDPLLQFDPVDAQNAVGVADAQLGQRVAEQSRAQVRVEAAQRELARLRSGATWLSEQELDRAKAEVSMANAELQSARAAVGVGRAQLTEQRLHAKRRSLVAPFDGTVVNLDIDPGDNVSAGQVVMRIYSTDRQVRFAFPPDEPIDPKQRAVVIKLEGTEIAVAASVSAMRPELDPSAQLVFATVPLPARLPHPERFLPGTPVQVFAASSPK